MLGIISEAYIEETLMPIPTVPVILNHTWFSTLLILARTSLLPNAIANASRNRTVLKSKRGLDLSDCVVVRINACKFDNTALKRLINVAG